MSNWTRTILVAAVAVLVAGCSSNPGDDPSNSINTSAAAKPSVYVLPPEVGTYTNVWATDSPVALQSESISVIRATVEGKAVAYMVGRNKSYPGYGRFLDDAIEAEGRTEIHVEDTSRLPPAIALSGTKHYLLYDVVETPAAVDARICEVTFGTYQPSPTHPRKTYEPADLRPVTDPDLLSPEGHIFAPPEMWRVRIERDPQHASASTPSRTPAATEPSANDEPERYPNEDVFNGWTLKQYSYESGQEPPCNDWAVERYPMALLDSYGLVYPTNPIDASYLPTLPPYPGWTHSPGV